MTIPVECVECGHRDGQLHVDHGVVTHSGDRVCVLPPQVQTPSVRVDRYRSPYATRKSAPRW